AHKIPIVFTAHDLQLVCPNHLMTYGLTGELCQRCITNGSISCFQGRCIHGSGIKSLLGTMENWLYKRLKPYKRIDAVICPSHFVKEKLEMNPQLAGRTIVLRNFISNLTDMDSDVKKKEYAVYFGRYSTEKGVETLAAACRELPDIQFIFAGKGELSEVVDSVENIQNKGFLSGEELHRLIAEARFSISASECPENCPFSVMESLKLGTPVIGTKIGGIPELIQDGETGLLVESGNKEELKAAIRRLWENRGEGSRYIQNCKNISFDNCGEYCRKLVKIYEDITT
ncbi:MAG: glycosyltransferase family 4 protein, partial [Butyrivibrio sp.]|nr:glycosyltransferase family 4 protein [Butyrivibrio sp.]